MRRIAAVSASLSVMVIAASNAVAADRFAMTCVENKTRITLRYNVRWGNGPWRSSAVRPGVRISHTWEYPRGQEGRSPRLYIRFDDDLSGKVKQREYVLESYRSPQTTDCIRYGREYRFRYDGSTRDFIDLYSVR